MQIIGYHTLNGKVFNSDGDVCDDKMKIVWGELGKKYLHEELTKNEEHLLKKHLATTKI